MGEGINIRPSRSTLEKQHLEQEGVAVLAALKLYCVLSRRRGRGWSLSHLVTSFVLTVAGSWFTHKHNC